MKAETFADTPYGDLTGHIYGGNITVSNLDMKSLKGAPDKVDGDFYCSGNKFPDFTYAPKEVTGDFDCSSFDLKSTKGFPKKVGGRIGIYRCGIKSLEDLPNEVNATLTLEHCSMLSSLKGCPKLIKGDFYVQGTAINTKDKLFTEIVDNKIKVVGKIHASFEGVSGLQEFTMADVLTTKKLGKYKDFLDL